MQPTSNNDADVDTDIECGQDLACHPYNQSNHFMIPYTYLYHWVTGRYEQHPVYDNSNHQGKADSHPPLSCLQYKKWDIGINP